jgi:hypothetical protein
MQFDIEASAHEVGESRAEHLAEGERLLMMSNDHGPNEKKQPYWIRWRLRWARGIAPAGKRLQLTVCDLQNSLVID